MGIDDVRFKGLLVVPYAVMGEEFYSAASVFEKAGTSEYVDDRMRG